MSNNNNNNDDGLQQRRSNKRCAARRRRRRSFNKGKWTEQEKRLFLLGLRKFGKGKWKEIGSILTTRSSIQIKSHGQKILLKEEAGFDIYSMLNSPNSNSDHDPQEDSSVRKRNDDPSVAVGTPPRQEEQRHSDSPASVRDLIFSPTPKKTIDDNGTPREETFLLRAPLKRPFPLRSNDATAGCSCRTVIVGKTTLHRNANAQVLLSKDHKPAEQDHDEESSPNGVNSDVREAALILCNMLVSSVLVPEGLPPSSFKVSPTTAFHKPSHQTVHAEQQRTSSSPPVTMTMEDETMMERTPAVVTPTL